MDSPQFCIGPQRRVLHLRVPVFVVQSNSQVAYADMRATTTENGFSIAIGGWLQYSETSAMVPTVGTVQQVQYSSQRSDLGL